MALQFKEKEAVEFGKLKVVPHVDAELELRLKNLDMETQEGLAESKEILAECFGEKKAEVKAFMDANMKVMEIIILRAYLIGGEKFVDMILGGAEKAMTEALNE